MSINLDVRNELHLEVWVEVMKRLIGLTKSFLIKIALGQATHLDERSGLSVLISFLEQSNDGIVRSPRRGNEPKLNVRWIEQLFRDRSTPNTYGFPERRARV